MNLHADIGGRLLTCTWPKGECALCARETGTKRGRMMRAGRPASDGPTGSDPAQLDIPRSKADA